jgi:hypothetical protein
MTMILDVLSKPLIYGYNAMGFASE